MPLFATLIRTARNARIALIGLTLALNSSAQAASLCEGLRGKPVTTESLYQAGQSLNGVLQLAHQNAATGCWRSSPYSAREACRRADRYGSVNGRFGSCATYTAFAVAGAIAQATALPLPGPLRFEAANLVRLYDAYGNPWDVVHPGEGDFLVVLRAIASELEQDRSVPGANSAQFRAWVESYRLLSSPTDYAPLLERLNQHFDRGAGHALPAELIMDGWVLDHAPTHYCSVRTDNGLCDSRGPPYSTDARDAHSALLVGRRLRAGTCEGLVRNSWKGACINGRYARTGRECMADADSVWINETELAVGLSGIRAIW